MKSHPEVSRDIKIAEEIEANNNNALEQLTEDDCQRAEATKDWLNRNLLDDKRLYNTAKDMIP